MEIDIDDEGPEWFAPDFRNNRELSFSATARVEIEPMTGRDKLKADHSNVAKTKADRRIADPQAFYARRQWKQQIDVIKARVKSVANWTFKAKDKNGGITSVEAKNIDELLDQLLKWKDANSAISIIEQIYGAITDASVLEEGLVRE